MLLKLGPFGDCTRNLRSFEMCCWTRMEKFGSIDRVKNEVLHRVKEETTILHTIKRRLKGLFICCVGTKPRY